MGKATSGRYAQFVAFAKFPDKSLVTAAQFATPTQVEVSENTQTNPTNINLIFAVQIIQ